MLVNQRGDATSAAGPSHARAEAAAQPPKSRFHHGFLTAVASPTVVGTPLSIT